MTKKGILFDMDGTLINTYENINFRQALSELKTVQKTLILKILKSRVRSFAEMETRIAGGGGPCGRKGACTPGE